MRMTRRYEVARQLRNVPDRDRLEVERFRNYLKDRALLSPSALQEKWGDYERGRNAAVEES